MSLIQGARFALLIVFILSFHQLAASKVQSVTADECLEMFGTLNDPSLRGRIKNQPELAVKCIDALLNGYAELEVGGRKGEAARHLRLASKVARTYLAVLHNPMLARRVALYRRWSLAQKREKVKATARRHEGQELFIKGEIESARKILLEGLEVERRLGDAWAEADFLDLVSILYHHHLGRPDEALTLQQQSLALNRQLGYTAGIATNLLEIGGLNEDTTPTYANELYLQALDLSREVKDTTGEIIALIRLANLNLRLDQPQEAAQFYKQLLAIADKPRHLSWYLTWFVMSKTLLKMGGLFVRLDLQQEASASLQQLEELLREAAVDAYVVCQVLNDAAEIYKKGGQPAEAAGYYEKVVACYSAGGHHKEAGNVLNRLGVLYKNQSLYMRALEAYGQALEAYQKGGERLLSAGVANNVGIVMDRQGNYKQALQYYRMALGVYEETVKADEQNEEASATLNKRSANTHANIGITYFNLGQYELALEYFKLVEKSFDPPSSIRGLREPRAQHRSCLHRPRTVRRRGAVLSTGAQDLRGRG